MHKVPSAGNTEFERSVDCRFAPQCELRASDASPARQIVGGIVAVHSEPDDGCEGRAVCGGSSPKLEAQERERREQIEAERVAASHAEAHDARERCANAHSAAQLIDMGETHGRHVPVIVTEDTRLGVRGLRELDPVIRYAMTGQAEAIKTLLRERKAMLLVA